MTKYICEISDIFSSDTFSLAPTKPNDNKKIDVNRICFIATPLKYDYA